MGVLNPALARKVGRKSEPEQEGSPADALSPSRRLRGAVMRAADKAIGLSLTVMGVSEAVQDAETLIGEGPEGWLFYGLCRTAEPGLVGLISVDLALRSAAIEVQTLGAILHDAGEERRATGLDAEMVAPVVLHLLRELDGAGLEGVPAGASALALKPMKDLRAVELVMQDVPHRTWQMSVQIGATERQGALHVAFAVPEPVVPEAGPKVRSEDWQAQMQAAVSAAGVDLDAELCRLRLPLRLIEGWTVGDLVDLPGATVSGVRLVRPGQGPVAEARLGQMSGARAVRIEAARPVLQEAPPPRAASGPEQAPALEAAAVEAE